jgi:hypothetical protein
VCKKWKELTTHEAIWRRLCWHESRILNPHLKKEEYEEQETFRLPSGMNSWKEYHSSLKQQRYKREALEYPFIATVPEYDGT